MIYIIIHNRALYLPYPYTASCRDSPPLPWPTPPPPYLLPLPTLRCTSLTRQHPRSGLFSPRLLHPNSLLQRHQLKLLRTWPSSSLTSLSDSVDRNLLTVGSRDRPYLSLSTSLWSPRPFGAERDWRN